MIWEYIKYEISKFSISFSKQYPKDERTKTIILEKELKQLETNPNFHFNNHYLECINNIGQIYIKNANGIKIRSKCDWYGFVQNFSSKHALQNQVRTLLCGQNEITDKNQINHQLRHFFKTLLTGKLQIQSENMTAYLNQISIPVLTGE